MSTRRHRRLHLAFAASALALLTLAPSAIESRSEDTGTAENSWQRVGYRSAGFGRSGLNVYFSGLTTGRRGFVAATASVGRRATAAIWSSEDGLQWSDVPRSSSPTVRRLESLGPLVGSPRGIVAFVQESRQRSLRSPDFLSRTRGVWWSLDGRAWEQLDPKPFHKGYVYDVDGSTTGFVAIGTTERQGAEQPAAWHSVDGRIWTRAVVPSAPDGPARVAHLRSSYVAAGGLGDRPVVWTSAEGRRWRARNTNLRDIVINLSSVPDGVVAITEPRGIPGDSLWRTTTGKDWKPVPAFHDQFPSSVADEVVEVRGTWVMAGSNFLPESTYTFTAWTRTGDTWTEMPAALTKPPASSGPRVAKHRGRVVVAASMSNAYWVWSKDPVRRHSTGSP